MDANVNVVRKKKNNGQGVRASAHAPDLDLNQLLDVLRAMQAGDFSVRLPGSQVGVAGKICDAFNTIIGANQRIAQPLYTSCRSLQAEVHNWTPPVAAAAPPAAS